jgi:hypothetical protein
MAQDSDAIAALVLRNDGPRLTNRNDFLIRKAVCRGFLVPEYLSDQDTLDEIAPPQFVKSFEERLAELTEKEREFYDEFLQVVREVNGWTTDDIDDWGVIRFMKARPKGVQQAVKMLDTHVEWQREVKPEEVSCTSCVGDKDSHCQQFCGWDSLHRPVVYSAFKWAKDEIRTLAPEAIEHTIECFRHCINMMPDGVEQWVNVVDFLTFSYLTDARSPISKAVVDVMEANYPERLAVQFLVDPPTAFFVLWKMLSPFIDERTKAKVKMVYTEKQPNVRDEFPKVFPPHMCEYFYECFAFNRSELAKEQAEKKATQKGWFGRK